VQMRKSQSVDIFNVIRQFYGKVVTKCYNEYLWKTKTVVFYDGN
jgi:hypothetical protein